MKDFYYILGVDANCSLDEIKDAYRKLSKKFHPDLNQGDAYFESHFREIKEAYETLSDPRKRREYNAALDKSRANPSGRAYNAGQYYQEQPNFHHYKTKPSSPQRSRSKGPGVGMTIILILIGMISAIYLVESFSNSRAHKIKLADTVAMVPYTAHKHHKKRHSIKGKAQVDSLRSTESQTAKPDRLVITESKPASAVNTKKVAVATMQLPSSSFEKKTIQTGDDVMDDTGNFLYATYVKANITGLINMRAYGDYNSTVIKTIPAHAKVFVLEKGDSYYRVFFDNTIGYVPKWSLQTK